MKRGILGSLSLTLLLLNDPAFAAVDTVVLKPTSPWGLEYSEDSCTMRRLFGAEGQRTLLEFRRFAPEETALVSVTTEGWSTSRRVARYRFQPDATWRTSNKTFYVSADNGFKGAVLDADVTPDSDEKTDRSDGSIDPTMPALIDESYKKATEFSISGVFGDNITLTTGSLGAMHAAMEQCVQELMTHWNIDVEAHRSLTRRAVPRDFAAMARFLLNEYPRRPLLSGTDALLPLRLAVDQNGKVTGCHLQLDIADPIFEDAACRKFMARGDFLPALDKDGKSIASYWTVMVSYTSG